MLVQSARFDGALTRLVAPLIGARGARRETETMPRFELQGRTVFLDPLQIFPVPVSNLGPKIASLADDASSTRIIAAIDEVLSRAFG